MQNRVSQSDPDELPSSCQRDVKRRNRNDAEVSEEKEEEEDWVKARRGIHLVLNNKYSEAQELFKNRNSVQLATGHSYIVFMNAVMTFEDESLEEAVSVLKEVENRCAQNIGWFHTVKNRVFGRQQTLGPYELLEQQIALADTQVCQAFLSMMTQETTTGFVKGGWALRKAWSLYHSVYEELSVQYKKVFGLAAHEDLPSESPPWRLTESACSTPASTPDGSCSSPLLPSSEDSYANGSSLRRTIYKLFSPVSTPQICPEEVKRLMCAVSFGYGLFHLCISLLPSPVLRIIHVLGFVGDRKIGIQSLFFSRTGPDMRAPLASLALLWYYTIMNPLVVIDNTDIYSGILSADRIIQESKEDFSNSSLFLFFRGRVHRLKNQIKQAVDVYSEAIENSGQKELSLLCLHEIGWCYLINLEFPLALHAFLQLKDQSRWSRSFYSYLSAVCYGCLNDMNHVAAMSQFIRRTEHHKLNQLNSIIARRSLLLMPTRSPNFYRLLAYEMLYLWNSLPNKEGLYSVIADCEKNFHQINRNFEPMVGLNSLIWGVSLGQVGEVEEAIKVLKTVQDQRKSLDEARGSVDSHISAWALYELAVLLVKSNKKTEAKEVLEKVQNQYSGYDFENSLKLKIHSVLKETTMKTTV